MTQPPKKLPYAARGGGWKASIPWANAAPPCALQTTPLCALCHSATLRETPLRSHHLCGLCVSPPGLVNVTIHAQESVSIAVDAS